MTVYVRVRDNVTIRAESNDDPAIGMYLDVIADAQNHILEMNRDKIAKYISDVMIYGTATMQLDY